MFGLSRPAEALTEPMEEKTLSTGAAGERPWLNTDLPFEERARLLVSAMTLEEKAWQMVNHAPGIERLGVPPYDWWNECLHGVARAGVATVFPQAIGLAATWNTDLVHRIATVISDEARAKHHEFARRGDRGIYKGLTFWSPNINIFRDPRWGRGQETYGECPFLTGRIGVAFVTGLQGDHPKYLKVVATPKHFAVHSGPEKDRHHFNAEVSPKDLRETYLPAFRDCVVEGKAWSVMGAYNRTNGEPCCASPTLLQRILREEWGFPGYVVSDCGAICDIHAHHRVTSSPAESAALAVRNGCDLCCGDTYTSLTEAVRQGLITVEEIDRALTRLYTALFRLGMFDPPESVPYASIPYEVNDCDEHRQLAREAARQSIVLLKNKGGLLPLPKDLKSLAVIGPNADSLDVLLGNYYGIPSRYVTLLEGIRRKVEPGARVFYAPGCAVTGGGREGFAEALAAAERADAVVMCLGLSPKLEGEEGEVADSDGGGDRLHIHLPGLQQELLEAVCGTGKPVVLVLTHGSPLAIPWAAEHVPAILSVWYPGEEGGSALADVLFGDAVPGGRLPFTTPVSLEDVPPFEDYRMDGRTYRFAKKEPLFPFGFGLSYTTFEYAGLRLKSGQISAGEPLELSVEVANTGHCAGDEVVQCYIADREASVRTPVRQLAAFRRITLQPGERRTVSFTIQPRQMAVVTEDGRFVVEPGAFLVTVGGSQGDARSLALGAASCVQAEFEACGAPAELPR